MQKASKFGVLFAALMLMMALSVSATAGDEESTVIKLHWNGEEIEGAAPVMMKHGRIFIPARWLEVRTETKLDWDEEESRLRLAAPTGDKATFYIDHSKLYWKGEFRYMDVEPFVADNRIYVPLKYVANIAGLKSTWDNETQLLSIDTYEVTSVEITASTEPLIVKPEIDEEELELLAKIIYAESGHESYEGQVAVGSVILNRVQDDRFPDTIRDVIYQPNQFGPARTGQLDKIKPSDDALRAAEQVLAGEDLLEGAVYFHNPRRDTQTFFRTLTLVEDIGNHRFLK